VSRTIAVADIGGTNARFAIATVHGGHVVELGEAVTMGTADHASFQLAWQAFTGVNPGAEPDGIGIAFAGPVGGDVLKLTNNPWVIRPALIPAKLGVRDFVVVNDFGAVGHAVAQLGDDHFEHLRGPDVPFPKSGVTTIVGPGTGLGVAQLFKVDDSYHVIETEGGHMDFAPLDPLEDQIVTYLRRTLRRISVERIASGGGFDNLYAALAAIEGQPVAGSLDDKALWTAALKGDDPVAVAALDRFFLSLGAIAGDLALAHGANSVVIAGGLGYRLRDRFGQSGFTDRFIAKGRFERRMEAIPVKLLIHPQPGLYGAAAAFAKAHP
jgi:glucokinase